MDGLRKYQGTLDSVNHSSKTVEDAITIEAPLKILINDKPFTVTMRTPGDDKELVCGLLVGEDIVRNPSKVVINLSADKVYTISNVLISEQELKPGYLNARNFLSVSSCGVCGKTELPTVQSDEIAEDMLHADYIQQKMMEMNQNQFLFKNTGGIHAAGLFSEDKCLSVKEDIGRHNAVDKVIGDCFLNDLSQPNLLTVSGRVSYEIIIKAFRGKIKHVASVSAPSSLAIDYAKELGIRLYAFCREGRVTRYS